MTASERTLRILAAGSVPVVLLMIAAAAKAPLASAVSPDPAAFSSFPGAPPPPPIHIAHPAPATAAASVRSVRFTGELDRSAVLRGSDGTVHVQVGIQSLHPEGQTNRVPTDLVVVLDRSGSMGGDKMLDAKAAASELVSQLGAEDRMSLVTFAGGATVDWPLSPATPTNRAQWHGQLSRLSAGGGTEMQAGIDAGRGQLAAQAGRARRVILISDGIPNQREGLVERARSLSVAEVPMSAVGIGNDYDEGLMTALADAGTGNFYWATRGHDLARVFSDELGASRDTVASGLAVHLDLPPGVSLVDAAGYPIEHDASGPMFRIGSLFAGQDRRFWLTLKVDASLDVTSVDLGDLELTWRELDGRVGTVVADAGTVELTGDRAAFVASVDADKWGQSVVEDEYNRLRTGVSAAVQSGNRAEAVSVISAYKQRIGLLNAQIGSASVTDNLVEVDILEADVAAQFEGADQRSKQNIWAKTTRSSSYQSRRVGSAQSY
ncbi:MAG: Ca-activated chloride channel family protein [Myxococcota bacterium]|jgi:Ca-activated chloride channel family protein